MSQIKDLVKKVDASAYLTLPLSDWRPILVNEVQVYVFGENYIAKRFDQIHYKFCEKNEAKEILIDNLFALLRYKYFPVPDEAIDERIRQIIASFTVNLKTTLKKISFDKNADCTIVNMLPDYCIAFRNGVYDFKNNDWLFKYEVIELKRLANKVYIYDPKYVILWYFNFDFEPLPIDICHTSLSEMISLMKVLTEQQRCFCFELLYNIAHNSVNTFDEQRFEHLCEILGYTCLQSFSQYFVMLIGSGQNGKNSLFDGCFTDKVIPRPASNDMDAIENDRFITGALENKAHNIFLETSAKMYTESKMIKALTGSMYQTIESKGVSKYSGVVNCKFIFAGNDQEKIKFSDTTTGFRRRINILEIYYQWDSKKRFLNHGDYYDTTFSDTLNELKSDIINITTYIYFAMFGIKSATNNFTSNFCFHYNDWNIKYSDADIDLQDRIQALTIDKFVMRVRQSKILKELVEEGLYADDKKPLHKSYTTKPYNVNNVDELLDVFSNPELYTAFFADNDIYISTKLLHGLFATNMQSQMSFTSSLKKLCGITTFSFQANHQQFIKCTFRKNKLKLLV